MTMMKLDNVKLGYHQHVIINGLSLTIEQGKIHSIIGPNGSGKSTLMKTLSKNLKPLEGQVFFLDRNLFKVSAKELSRQMAVLTQKPKAPEDLTVLDLVEHGRFPHRRMWKKGESDDKRIVQWAMTQTGVAHMAARKLDSLSGGEGQRAWLAMALAQQPTILLLDEPTTYLDINHQLEMLELVKSLNKELGLTVIMILHDIQQAIQYSHQIFVIKDGRIYDSGEPSKVAKESMFREVFSVEAMVSESKRTGKLTFEIIGLTKEKNREGDDYGVKSS
ncbi:ABC transporter ATP-binding protein [Bacillus horti]|uniref:Iron complex transport system ATP-binding protein n=1 Tax=Caldalkalibacillus horti TaxID=77523 RepID=A0ABT9W0D6_9BACI|nr:ABC transporter ATP-binding protein [Bacillus horti]MDQ0166502.1 iron complex transport system ATP-binding protein [Bacillus horti]